LEEAHKFKSSSSSVVTQTGGEDNRLWGQGVVSMTTSWLGHFLPQISIYNRILHKVEKGGKENISWCPRKNIHTGTNLYQKQKPR
jgi:hypothetical protein